MMSALHIVGSAFFVSLSSLKRKETRKLKPECQKELKQNHLIHLIHDIELLQECKSRLQDIEAAIVLEETMRSVELEKDIVEMELNIATLKQSEQTVSIERKSEYRERIKNLNIGVTELRKHQIAHRVEARARFRTEKEKERYLPQQDPTRVPEHHMRAIITSSFPSQVPLQAYDRRKFRINRKKAREVQPLELLQEGVYFYTLDKKNYINLHNGYLLERSLYGNINLKAISFEEVLRKTLYVRDVQGKTIAKKIQRKFMTQPLVPIKNREKILAK